jgi:hypothetical protein
MTTYEPKKYDVRSKGELVAFSGIGIAASIWRRRPWMALDRGFPFVPRRAVCEEADDPLLLVHILIGS